MVDRDQRGDGEQRMDTYQSVPDDEDQKSDLKTSTIIEVSVEGTQDERRTHDSGLFQSAIINGAFINNANG